MRNDTTHTQNPCRTSANTNNACMSDTHRLSGMKVARPACWRRSSSVMRSAVSSLSHTMWNREAPAVTSTARISLSSA